MQKQWPPNRYWGPKFRKIYEEHVLKSSSRDVQSKKPSEITMQGFIDSVDSNIIKPWTPEQYCSPIRGSKFEIETIIVKMFKTSNIKNNNAIVCEITMLVSSDSVDYKFLKQWPVKILSRLLLKNYKATIC